MKMKSIKHRASIAPFRTFPPENLHARAQCEPRSHFSLGGAQNQRQAIGQPASVVTLREEVIAHPDNWSENGQTLKFATQGVEQE